MRHAGIGERREAVVVGAGPAGLAAARALAARGVDHVVLEAGRIAESWRTARWDSFRLNTPRALSPGGADPAGDADGFASGAEVVSAITDSAAGLEVREGVRVTRAARAADGAWRLDTSAGALLAGAVVVASGFQRAPLVPAVAAALPPDLVALHAAAYRCPGDLPPGAVLVVGSAQSGVQIAEDLMEAGRRVLLSASPAGRVPRRHRGRDVVAWWDALGILDARPEDVPEEQRGGRQPQVSGTRGGHTVSLQGLAREGATLLGRLVGAEGRGLRFAGDLQESVRAGDAAAERHRRAIDDAIAARGIDAPPHEPDPAEAPEPGLGAGAADLDLDRTGIGAVIWATGFGPDLGWLGPGGADQAGLHPIGRPWLARRGSGILWGFPRDAAAIAARIDAARGARAPGSSLSRASG